MVGGLVRRRTPRLPHGEHPARLFFHHTYWRFGGPGGFSLDGHDLRAWHSTFRQKNICLRSRWFVPDERISALRAYFLAIVTELSTDNFSPARMRMGNLPKPTGAMEVQGRAFLDLQLLADGVSSTTIISVNRIS
jgi:hypothetical protein